MARIGHSPYVAQAPKYKGSYRYRNTISAVVKQITKKAYRPKKSPQVVFTMVMIRLLPDVKEFLKLLNAHEVEYLLIGGYAVAYHGYPRATADMDIWIAMHPANADRIVAALKEFGFQ